MTTLIPDHLYEWVLNPTAAHCESCGALDGQVHPGSEWDAMGLEPGCGLLICQGHCKCSLVDLGPIPPAVISPAGEIAPGGELSPYERGSLPDVPLLPPILILPVEDKKKKWPIPYLEPGPYDPESILPPEQYGDIIQPVETPPAAEGTPAPDLHPDVALDPFPLFPLIPGGTPTPTPTPTPEKKKKAGLKKEGGAMVDVLMTGRSINPLELGRSDVRNGINPLKDRCDPTAPIRIELAAASVNPAGEFEIMAITAGNGNGWDFTPNSLQESLPLWDGVEVFLDHTWETHSIRDLGGVCYAPVWDSLANGVKLKLRAIGPAAGLLNELGRTWLAAIDGVRPDVGFSADVIFTAVDNTVEKILRVLSLDLVYNPARGGEFIRALNQRKVDMTEVAVNSGLADLEREKLAVRALLDQSLDRQKLQDEMDATHKIRAEMCTYLLDAGLGASALPAPMAAQVRKQFAGKVFDASELQAAIDNARDLVSELTGGMSVSGPRIGQMVVAEDRLQCAVEDMLGAPRDADKSRVKAERLSGIRELYMMLTGDYDLHGGYHPDRARLATTTDFSGLVKNALNKMVVQQWGLLGRAGYDWWTKIATVEHFDSLNGITGTLIGTVGDLPTVAEGGEYTELKIGDSPETTSFVKYGGYIPLTLELIDRDQTRKLAAYPRELASASIRKISKLVAALFSDSSGAGPTMADTGALFNATAVTTLGGHCNLLTTALSSAQWEIVGTAIYNQPLLLAQSAGYYGTGPKMALSPRYCLVPRALRLTGMQILYPDHVYAANYNSENLQQGQMGDVVVVPDWTDLTDWAAVVDPAIAPAIFIGERFGLMPEIYISGDELSPAVFTNDEHRMKIRHFLAVWANDFRPLHNNHV